MKKRYMILCTLAVCLGGSSILTAAVNDKISMEEAKTIALNKVQGGTVTSVELDYKAGKPIYEVEVYLNGYSYDIDLDAVSGKGLSVRKEAVKQRASVVNTQLANTITQAEAKAIALKEVPAGTIKDIELDTEKNGVVYELEVIDGYTEYDIKIDAVTGEILKCEIDD